MSKTKYTETIVEQGCIEMLVTYVWEQEPSQIEECHGYHELGGGVLVDLLNVEVIIKGKSIDILPFLDKRQEMAIIDDLSIFEP